MCCVAGDAGGAQEQGALTEGVLYPVLLAQAPDPSA